MTAYRRTPLVILACLTMAACTSTASRVSTTYYVISGATGADLDREINAKGPLEGHALASAAIRFVPVTVNYRKTATTCSFEKATFRVDANITLPRWRQHMMSSDEQLRNAWRNLAAYARAHEEMHVKIAEKHAAKLGETLLALEPRKDCGALEATAKKVLERQQKDHDREQNRFDAAEQKRLEKFFAS